MSIGSKRKRSYEESLSGTNQVVPSNAAKKQKTDPAIWSCTVCTFDNVIADDQCEMCLNPRVESVDRGESDPLKSSKLKSAMDNKPKGIYVVMTAEHEIGSGSDYFMDSMLKETYHTQIIAVYASKDLANERAKREAFIHEGDPEDALSRWPKNKDPTLFFHEGEMEPDNPPRCTRVWVEQHRIQYQ